MFHTEEKKGNREAKPESTAEEKRGDREAKPESTAAVNNREIKPEAVHKFLSCMGAEWCI